MLINIQNIEDEKLGDSDMSNVLNMLKMYTTCAKVTFVDARNTNVELLSRAA